MLSCGCCDVYNFKDEYDVYLAEKEIRDYKLYGDDDGRVGDSDEFD